MRNFVDELLELTVYLGFSVGSLIFEFVLVFG